MNKIREKYNSLNDFVKQLDQDVINDTFNYGCVNGTISELIYYSDTIDFYDAFDDEIHSIVDSYIRDTGDMPNFIYESIGAVHTFKNNMVWFAVEQLTERYVKDIA